MKKQRPIITPGILGKAIAERRKSLGLTQAAAAARVGLNQKTISNIENQPEKSSIETLFKVMSALELELSLAQRNNKSPVKGGW